MICDDWLRIMNECSMLNVEKNFSTLKTICAKVAILIDSSVGNVEYDSLRSNLLCDTSRVLCHPMAE